MTFVGSMFCGVAIFLFLFTIYANVEGNRISATRHVFHDIRRDMKRHPAHRVWWRAFRIAMGWQRQRRTQAPSRAITFVRKDVHTGQPNQAWR